MTGTQVATSVLASVSAAVVASFFGVAGTLVGTAVVSVVATVGSAFYGQGIRRTTERLQQVQVLRTALGPADDPGDTIAGDDAGGVDFGAAPATGSDPGPDDSADVAGPTGEGESTGRPGSSGGGWRGGWLAERRWGVAAGVVIVFMASMAVVTLIELVGNRPLSGEARGAGRTSIGALLSDGDAEDTGDSDSGYGPGTAEPSSSSTTAAPDPGGAARPATTTRDPAASTTTSTSTSTTSTTAPSTRTETSPTTVPVSTTVAPPAGPPPPG